MKAEELWRGSILSTMTMLSIQTSQTSRRRAWVHPAGPARGGGERDNRGTDRGHRGTRRWIEMRVEAVKGRTLCGALNARSLFFSQEGLQVLDLELQRRQNRNRNRARSRLWKSRRALHALVVLLSEPCGQS